jgi:hypothetical protein
MPIHDFRWTGAPPHKIVATCLKNLVSNILKDEPRKMAKEVYHPKQEATPALSPVSPIPTHYPSWASPMASPASPYTHPTSPASVPSSYYATSYYETTESPSSAYYSYDGDDENRDERKGGVIDSIHFREQQQQQAQPGSATTMRALSLLDATTGDGDDHNEGRRNGNNNNNNQKSNNGTIIERKEIDMHRERGATMRALSLMDETSAGHDKAAQRPKPVSSLTARQAANINYEIRQKEKAEVRARYKEAKEMYGKRVPILVAKKPEKKAETTRKMKPKTAADFETVAEMKCQAHLDREKEAQNKALKLLNGGFMF